MFRSWSLLLASFLLASCTTNVLTATPPKESLAPTLAPTLTETRVLPTATRYVPSTNTSAPSPTLIATKPTRVTSTSTAAPSTEPSPQGSPSSQATPTQVTSTPTRALATPSRVTATRTIASGAPTRTKTAVVREELRPTADLTTLLPDLRMLEPTDLMIEITPEQRRLLRLTNYIINWGPGKLEVLGKSDPVSERTVVYQHIFRANGSYSERAAGIYLFHPLHNHWHFENFAVYQLWSLTPQGQQDRSVAIMDKVSYCLRDTGRSVLKSAALLPLYTECEAALQGINAGWIDSYEYDLPDQTIDITDLPDGIYALECSVDPGDRLLELDESNNSVVIYVDVRGTGVQVLSRDRALELLAQ